MTQDHQIDLPPIVFTIDGGYVEACCMALRSLAETTPKVDLIDVFLLSTALRSEPCSLLARSAGDLRLRFRQTVAVDRRFPVIGRVTKAVYRRLWIATALPKFDEAVYLDADIQVMGWTRSFPDCLARRRYATLRSKVHGCRAPGQPGEPG